MVPHGLEHMTIPELLEILKEERRKFLEFEESYISLKGKYLALLHSDGTEEIIPRR